MVANGARMLEINRAKVDALNVFPVPDGDTGTNMSLTMQSAIKEMNACSSNRFQADLRRGFEGSFKGRKRQLGRHFLTDFQRYMLGTQRHQGQFRHKNFCKGDGGRH